MYIVKESINYKDLKNEIRDCLPLGCCGIQLVFSTRCMAKNYLEDTYGIKLTERELNKLIREIKQK